MTGSALAKIKKKFTLYFFLKIKCIFIPLFWEILKQLSPSGSVPNASARYIP